MLRLWILALVVLMIAHHTTAQTPPAADPFPHILDSSPTLRGIAAEPERYRLQIHIAEIVQHDGTPSLRRFAYREDAERWYPASTIKLCAAVAALQHIASLQATHGPVINTDTPMTYAPLFDGEQSESHDATNVETGRLTVRHDVRQSIIASDNAAFNRLYEFAGQDNVNRSMREAGLASAHIVHRLAEARSAQQNRMAPGITLGDDPPALHINPRTTGVLEPPKILATLPGAPDHPIGRAHVGRGGVQIGAPMALRGKNFIRLRDLLNLVAMIVRPDIDLGLPGIELLDEHRALLIAAMTDDPSASGNPRFDPERFDDDWPHFFRPGLERIAPKSEWRVSNKIGLAYGFSSEAAFIEHLPTRKAFLLAACIYTNDNATLNDGIYEYDLAHRALADIAEATARQLVGELGRYETRAPSPWGHEAHALATDPVEVHPDIGWTSRRIQPRHTFTEAILSWNVDLPPDTQAHLQIRARTPAGDWSPWLSIGEAGGAAANWVDDAPVARVVIDTLVGIEPLDAVEVRVTASGNHAPTLHRLDLVTTHRHSLRPTVLDERLAGRVENPTPFLANTVEDEGLRSRLCSPLSLRMLIAARGVDTSLDMVIGDVYDERFDVYGNWPRAIQTAFAHGVSGTLMRFSDWASVRSHLQTVGPMAISVTFAEGELTGAPYGAETGHIMVLYGLDEDGNALVLDPALSPESRARTTYLRDELSEAWMVRAKGTAYVLIEKVTP
ncbi:MAG: serine hydrolase [Planctomycetota bacterium]